MITLKVVAVFNSYELLSVIFILQTECIVSYVVHSHTKSLEALDKWILPLFHLEHKLVDGRMLKVHFRNIKQVQFLSKLLCV